MLSSTVIVAVVVRDKNNASPIFVPDAFSVLENTVPGTYVGTVVATDGDCGDAAKLTFTIEGDDVAMFAINDTTGVLTVARVGLDRETKASYTIGVKVVGACCVLLV